MIVDIHAHALDEAFLDELTQRPCGGMRAEADGRGDFSVARANSSWTTLDPLLHRQGDRPKVSPVEKSIVNLLRRLRGSSAGQTDQPTLSLQPR